MAPFSRFHVAAFEPRHLAAVADDAGRVALHELGSGATLRTLDLGETRALGVATLRTDALLAVVDPGGGETVLNVVSMPSLAPLSTVRCNGSLALLGLGEGSAVLRHEGGLLMARLVDNELELAPLPHPYEAGAPISPSQQVVLARGKLTVWDAALQRPQLKVAVPLTAPRAAGGAADGKLLWVAEARDTVVFYRTSDFTPQGRLRFDGAVVDVIGHYRSRRLWAIVEAGDRLAAHAIDLREWKPESTLVATPPFQAACALWPHDYSRLLVVGAGGEPIAVGELDDQAAPMAAEAEPQTAVAAAPAARPASSVAERLSRWRKQLGEVQAATAELPPAPVMLPAEVPPLPAAAATAQTSAASPAGHWRRELLHWSSTVLSVNSATLALPRAAASTLVQLADATELTPAAERALAILYGRWLAGEGERGVPLVQLEATVPGSEELLGDGALARLGWVVYELGRLRLRPCLGHWLDGAPPVHALVEAPAGATPRAWPEAPSRVAARGQSPRRLAAQCAAWAGGAVLLVTLPAAGEAAIAAARDGMVEARLRGRLPLFTGAVDDALEAGVIAGAALVASDGDEGAAVLPAGGGASAVPAHETVGAHGALAARNGAERQTAAALPMWPGD